MTEHSALEQKYIGTEIGSFRIRRLLGMGGMGAVFLAEHKTVALSVAVKFLRDPIGDAEHSGRMLTEARALSKLEHPSLVRLNDCGSLPDGTLYLQMEYLRGQALPEYVRAQGGKLPLRQVLIFARQLASALSYVHGQGILHRDLKPSNLYVSVDAETEGKQRVKILDFGIAKLWAGEASPGNTQSNQLLGTPRYMSPEQCEGTAELDDRTDVYSLGLILFELLTGEAPYALPVMNQTAWLYAHVQRSPRALRKLLPSAPAELEALLSQMLDKLAVQRPTMAEVEGRLKALLSGGAPPPQPGLRPPRKLILLSGLALLLVGAVGTLAGSPAWRLRALHLLRRDGPPREPAESAMNHAVLLARAPSGMALIPGRSFPMGSSEADIEAAWQSCQKERQDCKREEYERERPQRVVTVSSFYLDQHEVTNEDYAAFLNLPLRPTYVEQERLVLAAHVLLIDLHPKASGLAYQGGTFVVRPGYARRPVVQVTWAGAQEYCAVKGKRLPTEAEWELAARSAGFANGPSPSAWPWGNEPPRCENVVIARDAKGSCHAAAGSSALTMAAPMEVGTASQDVTPQGVYDLAGNVREWVEDVFQVPYPACGACENPKVSPGEAGDVVMRVVRGGSFMQEQTSARAAGRSRWRPDYVATGIGLRCATSISQTPTP